MPFVSVICTPFMYSPVTLQRLIQNLIHSTFSPHFKRFLYPDTMKRILTFFFACNQLTVLWDPYKHQVKSGILKGRIIFMNYFYCSKHEYKNLKTMDIEYHCWVKIVITFT